MCDSPNSESFHPPKEWYAIGTGIGTLTPIIPTVTSRWNRRADSPLEVNTAVPLPYGLALIRAIASSRVSTLVTTSTGPKISSRYASICAVTWSSTVGPTKKPSSCPSTTRSRPSTTRSAPWASAEPNAAAVRWSAANSRSASGSTTAWFFAPPSAWTRLPVAVARSWMYRATGVEPTNETAAIRGESRIASTATLSPCTTLNTPSGSPARAHSSAMSMDADGSRSLGLSTNVLPQAIATGCIQHGTITGQLNGVIPATTPNGCRNEYESTPVDTWSE